MDLGFFGRGLVIGFAIAAPVGAIGVLCIRRTLADGRLTGFVSGLGAATADALYGAVAALGLTAISSALVAHQATVRLVGGLFLCYLGVRTALAAPATTGATGARRGLLAAYGSTLALTLTNPSTILSFAAVFAGLGLADAPGDRQAAGLLVARRLPRLGLLVAAAERRRRARSPRPDPGAPALGQPPLRRLAGRLRPARAGQPAPLRFPLIRRRLRRVH